MVHVFRKPVDLATRITEDNGLSNTQGAIQITQGLHLPILPFNIHKELLDTCEIQTHISTTAKGQWNKPMHVWQLRQHSKFPHKPQTWSDNIHASCITAWTLTKYWPEDDDSQLIRLMTGWTLRISFDVMVKQGQVPWWCSQWTGICIPSSVSSSFFTKIRTGFLIKHLLTSKTSFGMVAESRMTWTSWAKLGYYSYEI